MTDAHVIGKNSPLVPYVKISFGDWTTGQIPPKYVKSFSCNRIKDKTGTYKLTIVYAPSTFTPGDDYLGLTLANLFSYIVNDDTSNVKIPAKVEYGYYGCESSAVKFNTAVISAFSQNVDGLYVTYNIEGVLSGSPSRASKTKITTADFYDLDNDGDVDTQDWSLAISHPKNGGLGLGTEFAGEVYAAFDTGATKVFETTSINMINSNMVKAGKRLSDVIEILAKYIFKGIYNVEVEHRDYVYDEDTSISNIITTGTQITDSTTLLERLKRMVSGCYVCENVEITTSYYANGSDKSYYSESNLVSQEESKSIEAKTYDNVDLNIGNNFIGPVPKVSKKITKEVIKGEVYGIYYVDTQYSNGLPTIKIGPKSSVYNGAKFAHYEISNTNRYNNVVSYSHKSNLIPVITAFDQIIDDPTAGVDITTGEYTFTDLLSMATTFDQETANKYAEDFASVLMSQIDNTCTANLTVIFDIHSAILGITDIISINNTVNGGYTIFNGNYYITGMTDYLDGGLLKTDYVLIYHESNTQDYLKSYVLKAMAKVNTKITVT